MKYFLVVLLISLLASCSGRNAQTNIDTTIVHYNITEGKPLSSKDWHIYNIDEDKICIPEKWGFVKQDDFFFMSDLSEVAAGSYFVVVKQDKKATGLSALKYLKKLYTHLKQDSTEILTGSQAIKLTYDDKEVIFSEYNILIGKDAYIMSSTIFEIGNNLYDIAFKISQANADTYQEEYKNAVFNFYHNHIQLFKTKDEVKGAEIIDLTKL